MDTQLVLSRIGRCLLLRPEAFEELRSNPEDTLPALMVVVAASYAAGLGGVIWTFVAAHYVDHLRFFLRSFLVGSAIQAAVFLLWVAVTAAALEHVFRVPARYTELLRVMGFAFAPVALQALIFVPVLDQPIGLLALAATLFVAAYALQLATIATAGQAFCACLLGFVVFCCILGVLGNGPADFAPGLFALDPNSCSVGLAPPLNTLPC